MNPCRNANTTGAEWGFCHQIVFFSIFKICNLNMATVGDNFKKKEQVSFEEIVTVKC